uniref:Ano8 protein n=1 Tax=Tetraselmis sp. GSL018 TaxID=582737 RepID=A0A061RBB9_9CHLO
MPEYEAFDDYLEMVIQFGYIVMFAAAFPAASAISVLYNLIELKSDTYKLCFLYRRPQPRPARGIGVWERLMAVQMWLAVFTNLAIFSFSLEQMRHWFPWWFEEPEPDNIVLSQGMGRWFVASVVAMEHLMVFAIVAVLLLIPSVPGSVRLMASRERHRQQQLAQEQEHQQLTALVEARLQ